MSYVTRTNGNLYIDNKRIKGFGFNYYPLFINQPSNFTNLLDHSLNLNIFYFRSWFFNRGAQSGGTPSNSTGNFTYISNGQLLRREATYVHADRVLNEMNQRGQKVILSYADNPTYQTKRMYVGMANTLYGTDYSTAYPYEAFFEQEEPKQLYKDDLTYLLNRTNTIDGIKYKDHPAILWHEMGNELRHDVFDSEGGTQNTPQSQNIATVSAWRDDISDHIKSIDTNHLVSFGDTFHTSTWTNGDTVSNGSGYGTDYRLEAQAATTDILDFHLYPNQGGTEIKKFGQRLGYPNSLTGAGLKAQIRDVVKQGKDNGKPVVCGETGQDGDIEGSNLYYPQFPRVNYIKEFSKDFFDAGGDLIFIWHAVAASTSGSYDVALAASGGENVFDNSNDTRLISFIAQKNRQLNGKRIRVNDVRGITI